MTGTETRYIIRAGELEIIGELNQSLAGVPMSLETENGIIPAVLTAPQLRAVADFLSRLADAKEAMGRRKA